MSTGKPSSDSLGKRQMNISGPYSGSFVQRVSRDGEFTQGDRTWRNQFLKDQVLSHRDGFQSELRLFQQPEYYAARFNPVRRAWRTPFNLFEAACRNVGGMNLEKAYRTRVAASMAVKLWLFGVGMTYYGLYHGNNWETQFGFKAQRSKFAIGPDHEDWPHNKGQERTRPNQYATENFDKSRI